MSHAQPISSPPGTPLAERTVGEIVAQHPNLSRVFQARDLGFCCQGKLMLRDACERQGIDLGETVAALESELAGSPTDPVDPAGWKVAQLTAHIVERHHSFLRRELPRIYAMAERVAQVHGGHTPSLIDIHQVFTDTGKQLAQHVVKEEEAVFPALTEEAKATSAGEAGDATIQDMRQTHSIAQAGLARLRELTHGYTPPVDACNTYRALFAGLADFETDTLEFIRLEADFLLPALTTRQAAS